MRGQQRLQRLAQAADADVDAGTVLSHGDTGGQLDADGAWDPEHDGLAHAGQRQQCALDLRRVHAETSQLQLMIRAPNQAQAALGQHLRDIAGAVETLAGLERVVDEDARHLAAQVAAAQLRTAHMDLPLGAGRHQPHRLVEHMDPRVGQHLRQRQRVGTVRIGRTHAMDQHAHRGLGRAVVVVDHGVRREAPDALDQRAGRGFAAKHHGARQPR